MNDLAQLKSSNADQALTNQSGKQTCNYLPMMMSLPGEM